MKFKVILIILISFIISCSGLYSKEFKAKIYRISDGDTIWVKTSYGKKIKLRLIGIDTPEKFESEKLLRESKRCGIKVKQMRYLGILATKFAKSILKKGEIVTVKTFGKGYYKRTLAVIILPNGNNFNKLMVINGYACSYRNKYPYEEYEKIAKKEKMGLWKDYYNIMDCLCK